MTYCEYCDKDIKNDEWREHIISGKPLKIEEKRFCEVCRIKYDIHSKYNSNYPEISRTRIKNCRDNYHLSSDLHQKNQERLEFYSS